ncbi:MAG: uroporphyrinogen decarboxylase family protein [Nitrospiraceae bacterium]
MEGHARGRWRRDRCRLAGTADQAWNTIGHDRAVQGNPDPVTLFGPIPEIERRVADILRRAGGVPHIFNLGHGILPNTPVEHVAAAIDLVHKLSAR